PRRGPGGCRGWCAPAALAVAPVPGPDLLLVGGGGLRRVRGAARLGAQARARERLIGSLAERARRAEADQAQRIAEARTAERTQIAREMHDVLAHRLSLLATYAGAMAYRPDAPVAQRTQAADVIRTGAHEALEELRQVIAVLRDDAAEADAAAGTRPQPTLADLPALVAECTRAGMNI